ncbi:MAG TPA: hypothetical protein ENF42_04400 [Candidatus Bathyarchaeota archaeon]|nr:hypothetical protein [Candidatus Bathyarchaeota archaeon]
MNNHKKSDSKLLTQYEHGISSICGMVRKAIKFWARKDLNMLSQLITNSARLVVDPFCGSGTTGLSAIEKGISAILSDLNPVCVFISSTILSKATLDREIINTMLEKCKEIEKDVYSVNVNGCVLTLEYTVWLSVFECPKCGNMVNPLNNKTRSGRTLRCPICGLTFYSVESPCVEERPLKIVARGSNQQRIVIDDKRVLKRYAEEEASMNVDRWIPNGQFKYPEVGTEFWQQPRLANDIQELFTRRNLRAVAQVYSEIEEIWRDERTQGDILKLAFIASLANATKMIPHSPTSGPSWKLPRYWIPPLREERNFCSAFMRRMNILKRLKDVLVRKLSSYYIESLFKRTHPNINDELFVCTFKADALEALCALPDKCVDLIILDPPHYDEIQYFELTYLWQKWLEGKYKDERFSDYSFWRREMCINPKIGKSLDQYLNKLINIVRCAFDKLSSQGALVLIIHHREPQIMELTLNAISRHINVRPSIHYVPLRFSSTSGLHGKKKYLCIARFSS